MPQLRLRVGMRTGGRNSPVPTFSRNRRRERQSARAARHRRENRGRNTGRARRDGNSNAAAIRARASWFNCMPAIMTTTTSALGAACSRNSASRSGSITSAGPSITPAVQERAGSGSRGLPAFVRTLSCPPRSRPCQDYSQPARARESAPATGRNRRVEARPG